MMLEAILRRLGNDPDIEIVGTVSDGPHLVEAYAALFNAGAAPDVVLCDHSMPGMSGTDAAAAIVARDPEANVLILSGHDDPSIVVAATAAGARGFLLKTVAAGELKDKVRAAARGKPVFDPRIGGSLSS